MLDRVLRRELAGWGSTQPADVAAEPGHLLLGLLAWTRMHGIVSLEIEGFFVHGGVDPGPLYQSRSITSSPTAGTPPTVLRVEARPSARDDGVTGLLPPQ